MEWTEQDDARLRGLAAEDLSRAEIADRMNVSVASIAARAWRIRLSLKKEEPNKTNRKVWTEEETARLVEMRNAGKEFLEIGAILGKTGVAAEARYLRAVAKKDRYHAPRDVLPDLTPEQCIQAKLLWRNIRSARKIAVVAEKMGVAYSQVQKFFYADSFYRSRSKEKYRERREKLNKTGNTVLAVVVPPEVEAERDRAMVRQSLIHELLGLPAPGRSALDRLSPEARKRLGIAA